MNTEEEFAMFPFGFNLNVCLYIDLNLIMRTDSLQYINIELLRKELDFIKNVSKQTTYST